MQEEAMANVRTVKAFSCEKTESLKHFKLNEDVYEYGKRQAFWHGAMSFSIAFFLNAANGGIIYVGAILVKEGTLTVG
jgi:ABC-type multidrug transport system fused ATPase/permease subunit